MRERLASGIMLTMLSIGMLTLALNIQPVEATGLVGYWNFDEGTGNTAYDSSGNINDGVVVNATYTSDVPSPQSTFSLEFSGPIGLYVPAYSFVTIQDSPSLRPNSSLTIEAWMKAFTAQGRHILAKEYGVATDDSYALWYAWDGTLRFGIKTVATSVGVPIPPLNQWHHVAGVCNGSYLRLYLNGYEVASGQFTIQLLYDGNPVLIGADDNDGDDVPDEVWNGLIDEVKIYDYARTPQEIRNDYMWSKPVGGISIPVNKLALLAPYIGLTILLATAVIAVVYVKKRKKHTEINS